MKVCSKYEVNPDNAQAGAASATTVPVEPGADLSDDQLRQMASALGMKLLSLDVDDEADRTEPGSARRPTSRATCTSSSGVSQ